MPKATPLHVRRPSVGPELAATAFLLLVLAAGAGLLTLWLGLGR